MAHAPKATTTFGSSKASYADLTVGIKACVSVPAITKMCSAAEMELVDFAMLQAPSTKSTELASTPQQAKPACRIEIVEVSTTRL